jgi:hypothetical protein
VAVACLALSILSFAAPASKRGNELKAQLQVLRARINQESGKSESGLAEAERSALKSRIAQAAPEVARVRQDIRKLAAKLRIALQPKVADRLAPDRARLLSQMDASADDLLALFMQLGVDDPNRESAEDTMIVICQRLSVTLNTLHVKPPKPTPTPHFSPRPSHD